MSAVVNSRPGKVPGSVAQGASKSDRLRTVLLALGIVGPLFYVATDVLVSARWKGYRYTDHEVSELFAIDAPTTTRRPPFRYVRRPCDRLRGGRLGIGRPEARPAHRGRRADREG